ncbi:hypothetical protein RMS29_007915 [Agrobacterium rosae]|uniref:Uncharacterized protein n=1 Tax=Agrobacterium rosae TaxID=1972867 RepID=A0AAE5RZI3_9HYPH|nr:hypothetical protein [Agrobacterium rosae]KAA3512127.1 hypothetical protein DXM21_11235 [Agrobacterium rosae]KAA3520425.1 hypothetical protein DXM25_12385 [Agrobacterium rosae]MCM2432320.1 hypothetical protein [Agrobacterium rosae]MDX8331315.1 hypothetical protein [Agrobacterium rosae]MQB48726.1 hypothetical protein [Agrobacterium rosae]
MLLELLKEKREAIRQIGDDAAATGLKLGIEPSWIVYEKIYADSKSGEEKLAKVTHQKQRAAR